MSLYALHTSVEFIHNAGTLMEILQCTTLPTQYVSTQAAMPTGFMGHLTNHSIADNADYRPV